MFWWHERIEADDGRYGVDWAVTDRLGGSSQGAHAGFNLAAHVGDEPHAVETNRHRLARAFDLAHHDLRFMDQQHGGEVADIGLSTLRTPAAGPPTAPTCDALVTDETQVALVVLVADCTPVLLVDQAAGLAAAVHAGRPGLLAGVVPAAVERLRSRGATELQAVVGPSICGRCYEVPEQMRAAAEQVSPAAATVSWTGTPAIDVAAGVVDQLTRLQVTAQWLPGCARESPDLYSYRRDGQTGRYAGVVRLLPPRQVA